MERMYKLDISRCLTCQYRKPGKNTTYCDINGKAILSSPENISFEEDECPKKEEFKDE